MTPIPPTMTPIPATFTPIPTPTPEPTPTLTAAQLRDERATAVLITLPGYDPAHHDALLPLARALWGDEYVVDPADVALVAGETAVRVMPDSTDPYPSGTLFVWNADSHLLILTDQEDSIIKRGEVVFGETGLNTWIRYDASDNIMEFVDPAGNWINPMDIQTDGRFSFFTKARILADGSREHTNTVWWTNGGTPVELTTSPDPDQPLANFMVASQLQLTETQGENGRSLVALVDTDGVLQFTLDASGNWTVVEQAPLTAREYYSDVPFVFLPDDYRGIARGELPEGVTRILTMQEMDELAQTINFNPEYGCSTEYGTDGWYHTVAVIVSHGSVQLIFPNVTLNYDGFWLQTCGVGPNGQLVPVFLFAPSQGTVHHKDGTIERTDERSRVNFNTWNRASGQADTTQVLSPTYLAANRDHLIGQAVVLRQPSNTDNNPNAHAFADLVNPRRNGFADIDETSFNLDSPSMRPFMGTVALDKP